MPRVLTTALPEVILSIRGAHDADLLKVHDVAEVLSFGGAAPPSECTCHCSTLTLEGRQSEDLLLDGCRLLEEALQAIQHRNNEQEQAAADEEQGDSSDEDGEGIRLRVRVSRGAGEMWGITWHAHIFKTSQRLVVKDVAEGSVLDKWNSGRAEHQQVGYGDRLIRINGVRADDYPPPEAATKMRAELKQESIRAVFWRPGAPSNENVGSSTLHKVLMCAETEDELSSAATILAVWLIREQGVTGLQALEELLGEAWTLLQGKAATLRLLEANGCDIGEALQKAGDACKDEPGIQEMKVIFLDLDGVLLTKEYNVFDEKPLKNLQRLVALTGAKIVLSSDWRQEESAKSLAEQQLATAGLCLYSSTPVMPVYPEQRPSEVLQWLADNNGQVSSWVVLDDRDLLSERDGDGLHGHFVKTDPTVGFTDAKLDEACNILLEAVADSALSCADSGQLPCSEEALVPSGVYGCVRCRTPLFRESRIQPHFTEGARKATRQWASQESGCTSVFVEPMPWMGELAEQTGRLVCANPKCGQKLGSYSWHGLPCSCGQWQSPAFQVHLARVELMPGFKPHS
mmetsp:Transcript_11887/g.21734  ORF Transcript_11887/g.21734 Transcript_11887/m.21734 type:complete len:572 (+) Transcript_11887:30-1745(+)